MRHRRPAVKKALFMAALVAIRFNPRIKDIYSHLINDNKKKKMVALVACMRKIAITLNAKLKYAMRPRKAQEWNDGQVSLTALAIAPEPSSVP